MDGWYGIEAADFIDFNPRESLPKNKEAKKVTMERLNPFTRDVAGYETAPFSGGTKFRNGDTIMARITPCLENGKTAQVDFLDNDEVGFGSTEFIVMRAKPNISDADFVYYLATSPSFREIAIQSMVGSSGRQRVQQGVLDATELYVPPLPEQIEIGHTLRALDDKIANNAKINHHLEQMAQAIWSDRFGACEPNGSLGDIIELFDFKRVPLSGNQRDKMEKIYPYYGAAALMDYVDDYLFDGIYLLLGEDGTVIDNMGFPTLQYVWGKFWVNNHAHILHGRNGFTAESLYTFLKQTSVSSIVTGAVQLKINQANLKALPVVIPTEEEMQQFNDLVNPLFAQIRENCDENRRLAESRDTLLPRLMSGEISVANYAAK